MIQITKTGLTTTFISTTFIASTFASPLTAEIKLIFGCPRSMSVGGNLGDKPLHVLAADYWNGDWGKSRILLQTVPNKISARAWKPIFAEIQVGVCWWYSSMLVKSWARYPRSQLRTS